MPGSEQYYLLMSLVKDIIRDLNRCPDTAESFQKACDSLLKIRDCHSVTIAALDSDGNRFLPVAHSGDDDQKDIQDIARSKYHEILAHDGGRGNLSFDSEEYHTTIIPLRFRKFMMGVLILQFKGEGVKDTDELLLLEELADDLVLVSERSKHIAALEEKMSEYNEFLQNMSVLLFITDVDFTIRYVTGSVLSALSYPAETLIGTSFFSILRTGTAEKIKNNLELGFYDTRQHMEGGVLRADGSVLRGMLDIAPVSPGSLWGAGYTIQAVDITPYKKVIRKLTRSLKGRDLLIKEVNHRTKNNLQVISSLLNNYARNLVCENDKDLMEKCRDVMKGIVLIHETIYKARKTEVISLDDYIAELAEQLTAHYDTGEHRVILRKNLQPVSLPADSALNLALVVNEVLLNAFKHAFPGSRNGEISIDLVSLDPEWAELKVRDNGVGLKQDVDAYEKNNKGLTLVFSLIDQLSGEWRIENNPGVCFTVRFPLKRIKI
ncbi:MAG: ATP-binding protein [Spirochaetales bacterium]|nr:ATP-binding protein [Spirochaetales bacterium]